MADDLNLLFRVRGDASGAKQAAVDTRAAISQLRSQTTTDFRTIQQSTTSAAKGPQALTISLSSVQSALQGMRGSVATLEGPLGGIAGRVGSVSSLMGVLSTETAGVGGAMAGLGGPIGIAIAAVAALAVGVVGLSKQFIDLAVSTADWQGKLFDLSQQTGVSVETLSTLDAIAETTGGSIESIAQSLVIFQGKLEEAQNSTSKAGKQFAELGISINNTEQAFRDALKALAAMEEGFRQTNDATELFGRRGGKQVLAILKETNGDIDGTTEKLRALNSLVTTDVARGSDQLNDQLKGTQRQFRGLTAQIVNESMPLIVKALQDLSRILRENRETFILLGQAIGLFLQGNLRLIAPAVTIASMAFEGHRRALLPLIETYSRLAAVMQIVTNSIPNVDPNAIPAVGEPPAVLFGGAATIGGGIARKKGLGSGRGSAVKVSEGQRLLNQLTEEYNRLTAKSSELSRVQIVALEILDSKYKGLTTSLRGQILEEAAQVDAITRSIAAEKIRMDALKSVADFIARQNDAIRDTVLNEDEWDKQIRKLTETLTVAGVKIDDATFSIIKQNDAILKMIALNRETDTSIGELGSEFDGLHEKLAEFIDPTGSGTDYLEWLREIGQAIKDANIKEHIDALRRAQGERIEAKVGPAPPPMELKKDENRPEGAMDQLFLDIEKLRTLDPESSGLIAVQAGVEALAGAFQGLGQAVGQVVEAWVLYGSAGTSVRKVTAQILAGVAQQAAVKAVFELAEGFAALALAFFGLPNAGPSAAAHFTAAAIYGGIAGVAAIAGRAVAGDAFKTATGGTSSSGSRSSSSTPTRNNEPVDIDRRGGYAPVVNVTITGQATEGFKYLVEKVAVQSVRENGPFRKIQTGEDV